MAKGVRVVVPKYLVRNFTAIYEAIAAPAAPSNAVSSMVASPDAKSPGNFSTAAAPIIGVASKNENLSASSCANPTMRPPAIVDPVRENPGSSARTLHASNSCRLPPRHFGSDASIGVFNVGRALRSCPQEFCNVMQQPNQNKEKGHIRGRCE